MVPSPVYSDSSCSPLEGGRGPGRTLRVYGREPRPQLPIGAFRQELGPGEESRRATCSTSSLTGNEVVVAVPVWSPRALFVGRIPVTRVLTSGGRGRLVAVKAAASLTMSSSDDSSSFRKTLFFQRLEISRKFLVRFRLKITFDSRILVSLRSQSPC